MYSDIFQVLDKNLGLLIFSGTACVYSNGRCGVPSELGNQIEFYVPNAEFTGSVHVTAAREKTLYIYLRHLEFLFVLVSPIELSDNLKSDFISNMSHEFRTPLNGIIGMSKILRDTDLNSQQKFYLDNIEKCNYDLLCIVNDILDFSKLENGSLDLNITPFNIEKLLNSAIDVNLIKASNNGVTINYTISPDLAGLVLGDQQRIKQILVNLLSNAVKFTKNNTIQVNATIADNREPDYTLIQFQVIDSGTGIPKELVTNLFKPFTQAKSTGAQGTGLGLVICKQLCELMGGTIELSNNKDANTYGRVQGATATFRIKVKKTLSPQPNANENVAVLKDKYILIVDDNPINRLSLMATVTRWGMKPVICSNAQETLLCINNFPFYAGLIDIVMPEKDGIWLAKNIENKVPLIALSSLKEISKDATNLFENYLIKPVKEQVLKDTLVALSDSSNGSSSGSSATPSDTIILTQEKNKNKRILIVDDVYLNRMILEIFLHKKGLDKQLLDHCDSGKCAIEHITKTEYDIVFLDIKMPGVSGIDVYSHVKKNGLKRKTKFIAMTAYMKEKTDFYKTVHAFDDCVYKPINQSDLDTLI